MILETPYCTLQWDRQYPLLRFTRSAVPFPSTAVIEQEAEGLEHALARVSRPRLLVDLRAAAPRNDPEFEAAMVRFRRKILMGPERAAIVVRTAVGALQVKRHMREDGFGVDVFHTEEEAIAYLLSPAHDEPHRSTLTPPSPRTRSTGGGR